MLAAHNEQPQRHFCLYFLLIIAGLVLLLRHLSYNEKLAQLISKIDFNAEMKTSASDKKPSDSTESDDTKSGSADATASGSGGETASAKKFFQEMFERVK